MSIDEAVPSSSQAKVNIRHHSRRAGSHPGVHDLTFHGKRGRLHIRDGELRFKKLPDEPLSQRMQAILRQMDGEKRPVVWGFTDAVSAFSKEWILQI